MKKHILILLSAAVTLLLGCTREEDRIPENQGIRFRVSAGSEAVPTKTLYSGDTYDVGAGVYKERIDWSAGDRISIYCPESSGDKVGIYSIGGAENSTPPDEKSHASGITSVDGKLQWGGATKYNFYARYPDPSWSTGPGTPYAHSAFSSQGANSTSFLCYLPATQTVTDDGTSTSTYLPEMKYCYMTASALNVDKLADDITLSFSPAVNTLEITIPNDYSSGTFTISELKLVSASHRLNGEYSINVATGAATVSETSLVEADRTITLNFGSDPITVPNGGKLKFTVFTCPVNLNDITLYLTLDDGYVRTLPLKYETSSGSGSYTWLSFDAFKKYRVNCSTVADPYIYEIRTDAPEYTITPTDPSTDNAGTATIKVASTKNKLGEITASPWKAQWLDGSTWTDMDADHHPEGVTLSQYEGYGSLSGEDITITVPAGTLNTSLVPFTSYTFATAPTDNSSEANAIDLSKYNFLTNTVESTYETANCYVIRAPGWYKFPLVYGNAVKGASLVAYQSSAYTNLSGTSSEAYMGISGSEQPFIDGNGNPISGSSISFTGTPGVGIVWTDAPSAVIESSTIKINGGYVFFNVPSASIYPSNTVIKVTNSEKNVETTVWSWHIWMVPEEMDLGEKAVYKGEPGVLDFYMLTANVGQRPANAGIAEQYESGEYSIRFVSKVSGRAGSPVTVNREALILGGFSELIGEGLCTYYQWGRKDPMMPANPDKTNPMANENYVNVNDITLQLKYAAANPDKFLMNSSNFNWWTPESTPYWNMWDTGQSGSTHYTSPTKSVYDPSPRGYCVPRRNDFITLSNNGWSRSDSSNWSTDTGKMGFVYCNTKYGGSETLAFPASGTRNKNSTTSANIGISGLYWVSSSNDSKNGNVFWFSNTQFYATEYLAKANAYPIRSIRIPTP